MTAGFVLIWFNMLPRKVLNDCASFDSHQAFDERACATSLAKHGIQVQTWSSQRKKSLPFKPEKKNAKPVSPKQKPITPRRDVEANMTPFKPMGKSVTPPKSTSTSTTSGVAPVTPPEAQKDSIASTKRLPRRPRCPRVHKDAYDVHQVCIVVSNEALVEVAEAVKKWW